MIFEIVKSGRGYKAITDIAGLLSNQMANYETVIRELKSEQKAIKKICEGKTSYKEKVKTVLTMME